MTYVDANMIQIPQQNTNVPSSDWALQSVQNQFYKRQFHGCHIEGAGVFNTILPTTDVQTFNDLDVSASSTVHYDTDTFRSGHGVKIPAGMGGMYIVTYYAEFGNLASVVRTRLKLNGDETWNTTGGLVAQTLRPNKGGAGSATDVSFSFILPLYDNDTLVVQSQFPDTTVHTAAYGVQIYLTWLGSIWGATETRSTYARLRNINNPANSAKALAIWGRQVRENSQAQMHAVGLARECFYPPAPGVGSSKDFTEGTPLAVTFPSTPTNVWTRNIDTNNMMPAGQQGAVIPQGYGGLWMVTGFTQWYPRDASQPVEQLSGFHMGCGGANNTGFLTQYGSGEIGADAAPTTGPTVHFQECFMASEGDLLLPWASVTSLGARSRSRVYFSAAWLGAESS